MLRCLLHALHALFTGSLFPPKEIYQSNKLFSWHPVNPSAEGCWTSDFPDVSGTKMYHLHKDVSSTRFLWWKISSPQCGNNALLEKFYMFWIAILNSSYLWDTKTKHLLKHTDPDSKITNWVKTIRGIYPK